MMVMIVMMMIIMGHKHRKRTVWEGDQQAGGEGMDRAMSGGR
jgi:hypothetical protein